MDINEAEEPTEKRKVPVLCIEGAGLMYKAVEKKKGEIHRIQIAEGVERNGKRTRLIGTHYFSSTNSTEEAWTLVQHYLYLRYDLSETLIISNSDSGSGCEFQQFDAVVSGCFRHEHVRDTYYVNQKIKQRLSFVPALQSELRKAIYDQDWNEVEVVLDTAERAIEEGQAEKKQEQIRLLRGYLERNWEYLVLIVKRGLKGNGVPLSRI